MLFRKSGSASKQQFRRRRETVDDNDGLMPRVRMGKLSFADDEETKVPKRKKHHLRQKAPVSSGATTERSQSGGTYDAASLAALKAAQRSAPPPQAETVIEDSDDDEEPPETVEVASPPTPSQLPEYVPLDRVRKADEAHRQRWLRAGADIGDVDAPIRDGALARGAQRLGLVFDDDDVDAWEREVAARGSLGVEAPEIPTTTTTTTPTTQPRRRSEDLERAAAFAEEDRDRAQREAHARQSQLDAQDLAIVLASIDAAKASASLTVLRQAYDILQSALAAPHRENLQLAVRQAADLAGSLAHDDPDDIGFGVYADNLERLQQHHTPGDDDDLGSVRNMDTTSDDDRRPPPPSAPPGDTTTVLERPPVIYPRTFDNADAASRLRAGLGFA